MRPASARMVTGAPRSRASWIRMPRSDAVAVAQPRVDGEVVADRREHALLHQDGGELVADLELPGAERRLGFRHHQEVQGVAGAEREQRQRDRRPRQAPLRDAGGAHHHQLPVGGQPHIHEQRDEEGGDRQDDGEEARQQQPRQLDEDEKGQAAVEHQLDEPERLREPHQHREAHGDGEQADGELAEDVAVEPGHGRRTLQAGAGARKRGRCASGSAGGDPSARAFSVRLEQRGDVERDTGRVESHGRLRARCASRSRRLARARGGSRSGSCCLTEQVVADAKASGSSRRASPRRRARPSKATAPPRR